MFFHIRPVAAHAGFGDAFSTGASGHKPGIGAGVLVAYAQS
jgi:hypothetical protein